MSPCSTTTEKVRATQGLLRGADGKLKASLWGADISLPSRDVTNPRYGVVYYKESNKTPTLTYGSPGASPALPHPVTTASDYALMSIYQPPTGGGGLVLEDFRMNPSLDATGFSECFQVIPASVLWTKNVGGTGAVQTVFGGTQLSNSTGGTDYAAIESIVLGNTILQWDMTTNPLFYMRWVARAQTAGMNAWFGFGIGGAAQTENNSHIAFKVTGNNWYLSNYSGAESNTLLMADDHGYHVFELIRLLDDDDSGYKSVAYIDGIYRGQNRDNMPTGTLKIGAKGVGYNAICDFRHLKLITQEE